MRKAIRRGSMKKNVRTTQRRHGHRAGYLYVAVVLTATIVSIIGFASMNVARTQLRNATMMTEHELARGLAQSGIELGIAQINSDPGWQTNIVHDTELPTGGVSVNGGTMHWLLEDAPGPNGKLLTGIGRKDDVEVRLQVQVGTGGSSTVGAPLLVGGSIITEDALESILANGGPIRSNSSVTNWGTISGNLEAQAFSNYGTYTGTATVPSSVHDLPDPESVFDYYVTEGTLIPNGPLDDGLGGLELENVLLSPFSNPYGAANSDGIYVIDADGKSLDIRNVRIVGTLVVLNGASGLAGQTDIRELVNIEPAYSNYPSLMIDGDVEIEISDLDMSESSLLANLNPSGTPYQGDTDTDQADAYPSRIAGVVYVSGNLNFDGGNHSDAARFNGVLICTGNLSLDRDAQVSIDLDTAPGANPPPGFGVSGSGQISPGSWTRVQSP